MCSFKYIFLFISVCPVIASFYFVLFFVLFFICLNVFTTLSFTILFSFFLFLFQSIFLFFLSVLFVMRSDLNVETFQFRMKRGQQRKSQSAIQKYFQFSNEKLIRKL